LIKVKYAKKIKEQKYFLAEATNWKIKTKLWHHNTDETRADQTLPIV